MNWMLCYQGYAKYRSIFSPRKVNVLYSALWFQFCKKVVFSWRRYSALCCTSDLFCIMNCMQTAARSRTVWFWENSVVYSSSLVCLVATWCIKCIVLEINKCTTMTCKPELIQVCTQSIPAMSHWNLLLSSVSCLLPISEKRWSRNTEVVVTSVKQLPAETWNYI